MKKNQIIHTEINGRLVIGELTKQEPNLLEVQSIYPYYGFKLRGKPKMCMLFSENSYPLAGKKLLATVYRLNKRLFPKSEILKADFIQLQNQLKNTSNEQQQELMNEFEFTYLNGFKGNPEYLIHPLEDLLRFLEEEVKEPGHPLQLKAQINKNFPSNLPLKAISLSLEQKIAGFAAQIKSGKPAYYYSTLAEDFVL